MWVWKGQELRTLEDAIRAALAVQSRGEGKRFMCAWLEAAPSLTEEQIVKNVTVGTAMFYSDMYPEDQERAHREWHEHLALLVEGGGDCDTVQNQDKEEPHERDEM